MLRKGHFNFTLAGALRTFQSFKLRNKTKNVFRNEVTGL